MGRIPTQVTSARKYQPKVSAKVPDKVSTPGRETTRREGLTTTVQKIPKDQRLDLVLERSSLSEALSCGVKRLSQLIVGVEQIDVEVGQA